MLRMCGSSLPFFLFCFLVSSDLVLSGRPPRLIEAPSDSVVPRNEPATLNCRADGDPPPQITWLKDGKPIRVGGLRNFLPSGALFFLRVRKDLDSGVYSCVASNSFGEVTSRNATLDVATLSTDFKTNPQDTSTAQGDDTILECEPPKGTPEPKVSWKKNGIPIDIKANGRYTLLGSGSLSISQVRQSDEGRYACVAKNVVGSRQSTQALLRVMVRPEFTIRPSNTSALLGGDVSLSCVAKGDPPPELTWNKLDGLLPFKRVSFDEERFLISNVTMMDSGGYQCVAANKAGSINWNATINVLPLPRLTMIPQDIEIQPNSTAYFGCEAEGDPPPVLFWLKEGGTTSNKLVFQGSRTERVQVTPQGTLQIDNVTEDDEGHYFCAAVSIAGSVIQRVNLKVTPIEELAPPIVLMGPSNQTHYTGDVAVLPCVANGSPLPVITWYKDGKSFVLSHRVFTDDAGTLRINDLEPEDSGLYECVASSRSGKYAWKSQLTVLPHSRPNSLKIFDPFVKRPQPPQKPYLVKVDSSSITIAWVPNPEDSSNLLPNVKSRSIDDLQAPEVYIDDDPFFKEEGKHYLRKRESETDAFFKALQERAQFPYKGKGESSSDSDSDYLPKSHETTEEDKYDYEDYEDEIEPSGSSENLILTTPTTTTASTTTIRSSTTTSKPKPSKELDLDLDLINPKSYVNPSSVIKDPSITYKIEYYSPSESDKEWLLAATNVGDQTFTLKHLKPNSEYSFIIRSFDKEGKTLSSPSPSSEVIRTLSKSTKEDSSLDEIRDKLGSNIISILKNAFPTSSTSIKLEWKIVSALNLVEGFYIYYRRIEESDGSYQMLTVLNAGASTFQIVGLDKYATYQVFLVPFYKNLEGRPSNYVNVSTLQDVPTAAPELTDTTVLNRTSIIVRWKPPPGSHHNGVILGYQLRVWQGSSLIGNRTTDALTTSLILPNLSPGQSYSLQIGCFTAKGIGVFSQMQSVRFTPPEDPFSEEDEDDGSLDKDNDIDNPTLIVTDKPLDKDNRIPVIPFHDNDTPIPFGGGKREDQSFSEAWFIALIGCVIFAMMMVFVFALYLRRCQIRSDSDKLKAPAPEIPDGSIPPHYTSPDSLWIDPKPHQFTLKSLGFSHKGENEYENANNAYAIVQDRHEPIAYATTTLVNNNQKKHKSTFSVFDRDSYAKGRSDFMGVYTNKSLNLGGGSGVGGWGSVHINGGHGHGHPTGSLINNQDMKNKPPWLLSNVTNPPLSNTNPFLTPVGIVGNNGPCSSSQSSSSHSSASSEALMKQKMSISKPSSSDKRRGNSSNSRPGSRGQGREDDIQNEYMDMDEEDNPFEPSLNMGGHVLTTFQTPLPTRKHIVVDYTSGGSSSRLNNGHGHSHSQYAHPSHNLIRSNHQF